MCHRSWSGRARGAPRQLFAASKLFVAEAAASSGEKSRQQHIFVKCSSFDLLARCNFRSATEKQERAESSGFFGNPALCDGCSSLSPEYYKRHYKSSRNAVYLPHIPCSTKLTRADGSLAGLASVARAYHDNQVSCLARTEVLAEINIDVFMTKVPGAVR